MKDLFLYTTLGAILGASSLSLPGCFLVILVVATAHSAIQERLGKPK